MMKQANALEIHVTRVLTVCVFFGIGVGEAGCNDFSGSARPDAEVKTKCASGLKAYKTACIPIFDACKDNEVPMPGGGCKRVGVERCEGGIKGPPDWTCKPIGPPTKCLAGWEKVAGGWCEPIIPPTACTGMTMAKIGHRTCQPIMDCGTGKWGNIKTTPATIFVDQSYIGNDSDGSKAKPYKYINPVVQKAPTGAHIAVAAGIYQEDLNINAPMTIEGVCPQKVTIDGQGTGKYGTVDVFTNKTVLRGVTITGTRRGVEVFDIGASALLDRVAIVGCNGMGIHVQLAHVAVRDSLIANNRYTGIMLVGAKGTFDNMVIRETSHRKSDNEGGAGIAAFVYEKKGSTLIVNASLLDGNKICGIEAFGSSIKVSQSVIRNTMCRESDGHLGMGILASIDWDTRKSSTLTVDDSVIAANHYAGIVLQSAVGTVQRTVVKSTEADSTQQTGRGIDASLFGDPQYPSTLKVIDSLVVNNRGNGIRFFSSNGVVERTLITGTRPVLKPIDGGPRPSKAGYGVQAAPASGATYRPEVMVVDSLVSANHATGLLFVGSQGAIKRTIVADTLPDAHTRGQGTGVVCQASEDGGIQSEMLVQDSLIERNYSEGIKLLSSTLTLERTIVRDTQPEASSRKFGFGVVATAQVKVGKPATLKANDSIVINSTTAGVAVSDSVAEIHRSVVRMTAVSRWDHRFGVGIEIGAEDKTVGASGLIRDCLVDTNHTSGVLIQNALAKIERSVVSGTQADKNTNAFGDGIQVRADEGVMARVDVVDSLVQDSNRAGVVFFGGAGSLRRSVVRSGKFAVVLEWGSSPEIGADNVYEDHQRPGVIPGLNLEPTSIPKVPDR